MQTAPSLLDDARNQANSGSRSASKRRHRSSDRDDGCIELLGLVQPDGLMLEPTYDPSRNPSIQFAGRTPEGNTFYASHFVVGDKTIVLPQKSSIRFLIEKPAVILAPRLEEYTSKEELLSEVVAFIHKYGDIEHEWELLLAHYVLLSYVFDRFSALPYLKFEGEPDTGKSRFLDILEWLCYRAVSMSGATSPSPMFRMIELFHPTLLVDEADYRFSEEMDEIAKILNCGYMKGKPVWRSEKDGDTYEPKPYDVFSPKIIAQRHPFKDIATETRCLTYRTKERPVRKDIPRQIPPEFYAEAATLRGKLLKWRFDTWHKIEVNEKPLLEMGSRAAQIGAPLLSVSNDPSFQKFLVHFLALYEKRQKEDRPQAFLLQALIELHKNDPRTYRVGEVVDRANLLAQKREVEIEPLTPRSGGPLISSMGFEKRKKENGWHVLYNKELAETLSERYSITCPE